MGKHVEGLGRMIGSAMREGTKRQALEAARAAYNAAGRAGGQLHQQDADCDAAGFVDPETGDCLVCGVSGGGLCMFCGPGRFHTPGCPEHEGVPLFGLGVKVEVLPPKYGEPDGWTGQTLYVAARASSDHGLTRVEGGGDDDVDVWMTGWRLRAAPVAEIPALPCGHRVPRDPERADWCSACEREEAAEEHARKGANALAAFKVSDNYDGHHAEAVFEHGQWWINCLSGAQYSVVEATGGPSIDGFDFEMVSAGDDA